jgi:hypothetical protein
MRTLILGCALTLSLTACAGTQSRYHWGGYEHTLYAYSKNPEKRAEYEESLREAIAKGEELNKVAPGLYAELGWLALEAGDQRQAAEAFEREMQLFPESRAFLTKVNQRAAGSTMIDTGA